MARVGGVGGTRTGEERAAQRRRHVNQIIKKKFNKRFHSDGIYCANDSMPAAPYFSKRPAVQPP